MNDVSSMQIHASCVSLEGAGVLIRGPSGAGKSDLALRLVDRGGRLVADDWVDLRRAEGVLMASAPPPLAGLLEVRGVGILKFPNVSDTPVHLAVDLVSADQIGRLPAPENIDLHGVSIPVIRLNAFTISAATKVQLAMGLALGRIIRADD